MNIKDVDLIKILNFIPVASLTYDQWIRVGMALKEEGYSLNDYIDFSMSDSRFKKNECSTKWKSFRNNGVTGATIINLAKDFGYIPTKDCYKDSLTWKNKIEWYYSNKHSWTDKNHVDHIGYGEGVCITAIYDYVDEDNKYLYSKVRIEGGQIPGKLIRYYYIDRVTDQAKIIKHNDLRHVLYRLPQLINGISKGNTIYIVEGEKDVETLANLKGFNGTVTTPGSSTDWKSEYASYFKGSNIVLLRDNDQEGLNLANKIRNDIKKYAFSIKVVNISSLEKGDITDYLTKEKGTLESLYSIIDRTEKEYPFWIELDSKQKPRINQGLLSECIANNENYKVVRNSEDDKDSFYLYRNGVYEKSNKNNVKAMIRQYVPNFLVSENLLNNVYGLLISSFNHLCSIEDLDTDIQYINLRNGLYDIKSNQLVMHTPNILSTIQLPFEYDPDNDNIPTFKKYIDDLCSDINGNVDKDKQSIIQEFVGLVISSDYVYKSKKCLILVSELGNSGKSVLISLIESFFGMEKITSINLTEIVPGNQFILGRLPTTRLITCGDESNTNVKDSSIFKRLTTGDSIKVESKGRQGYSYKFTGGIILACNGLPCFTDDHGNHLFDRLLIVPCEHSLKENERDSNLIFKLKKELPGIFNWFLEGYKRLLINDYKFTESKSCIDYSNEYRQKTDNLYRFIIQECIITNDPNDKIERSQFDKKYHEWATVQDNIKEVSKSNIVARMKSLGVRCIQGNIGDKHKINIYIGIMWKSSNDISFVNAETKNDQIPFK